MQWTRLLDQDGKLNPEGAAWYHKLIDCANENGIDIFMNMYHFDMPEYLVKRVDGKIEKLLKLMRTL